MRRIRFPFLLPPPLTMLAMVTVLLSMAWAAPKFKILQTVRRSVCFGIE